MISTGIALAKAAIRSISAPRPRAAIDVEQAVDALDQALLHRRDVARRQRAGDQAAHARVQRRIVEDQAGRVVLEQRRGAVLRQELLVLVGAEGRGVLVDGDDVGVAAEEDAAVGHALDRRVLAQGAVGRDTGRRRSCRAGASGRSRRRGRGRRARRQVYGQRRRRLNVSGNGERTGLPAPLRWRLRHDSGDRHGVGSSRNRHRAAGRPRSGTRSPTSARCTRGWCPASSPIAGSSRARASSPSPTAWSRAS